MEGAGMKRKRVLLLGGISLALLIAYGSSFTGGLSAQTPLPPKPAAPAGAPSYSVSPLWPKPLPMPWAFGAVSGVAVDADNHVWWSTAARTPWTAARRRWAPARWCAACRRRPFSSSIQPARWSRGGVEGLQIRGLAAIDRRIAVDSKGNLWIAAFGPGPRRLAAVDAVAG
jgi:hypothetical protein